MALDLNENGEMIPFHHDDLKPEINLICGEGFVDTVITGPGKVCPQTVSVPKLAKLLIPFMPQPKE